MPVVDAQVVARGERVGGVQAQAQPRVAAQTLEQSRQSARTASRACSPEPAEFSSRSAHARRARSTSSSAEATCASASVDGLAAARADVDDDARQADAIGPGQRTHQVVDRRCANAPGRPRPG